MDRGKQGLKRSAVTDAAGVPLHLVSAGANLCRTPIHNVTEGLGIVIPIAKDKPSFRQLAMLGLVAGAPAIVGAWIGGLLVSQPLSVLFLSIGAGAVFQVAFQIGRELVWRRDGKQSSPLTAFAGVMVGMLALYVTGVFIK